MGGMKNKQETALLYNLPVGSEQGDGVRKVLAEMKIRPVTVSQSESGKTLSRLLGLSADPEGESLPLPEEPVLVLYHLSDKHMNQLLTRLHTTAPVELKAMVTPVNRKWTFGKLCGELAREREAIEKQGK